MHFTLHMTTACNMRCDYCYAPPRDSAPMTFETGRAALDLAARLSSGPIGIAFFGGEPLLCKTRIAELVDYARHQERRGRPRHHFKVTTNGVGLDEEWLAYAVRNDILVGLSCDGIAAAHNEHRRLPHGGPSHALVEARLKLLLAARPFASVYLTVNPDTAAKLAESVAYLLELGVRYLIVSLNYAAAWSPADMQTLRRQFERLGRLYIEWTRAGRKFYLSPLEVKLSSHINRHCWQKERCELGQRQISVDPQGHLFPCVQFPQAGAGSDWCIGHVRTGIDESRRQRLFAASAADKEICRDCALNNRCHNTCGCLNWQATGHVDRISPVLCEYERMLTRIADRVGARLYRQREPHFLHKHYNAAYPYLSLLEETGAEN